MQKQYQMALSALSPKLQIPITPAALAVLLAGCWWLTIKMAVDFQVGAGMDWQDASLVALFVMWAAMMAAMMLPSAVPFLRLFSQCAKLHRHNFLQGKSNFAPHAQLALLAAGGGYLMMWVVFSFVVAYGQLMITPYLNSTLALSSTLAQVVLLVVAGGYQLSPLKFACLRGCRPPPLFLLLHWRRGTAGALMMGMHNGAFCLACCWALMLLLFVGGIMDIAWIVGLAIYAWIEKTAPMWLLIPLTRISGVVLVAVAVMLAMGVVG